MIIKTFNESVIKVIIEVHRKHVLDEEIKKFYDTKLSLNPS